MRNSVAALRNRVLEVPELVTDVKNSRARFGLTPEGVKIGNHRWKHVKSLSNMRLMNFVFLKVSIRWTLVFQRTGIRKSILK